VHYKKKPENVQMHMFVCPTSFCPGNCPFCFALDTKAKRKLNIDKFADVMRRLKAEDRIKGVKITGGEPFSDVVLLNEVISVLYEIFGYGLEISVSTNGIRLEQLHGIKDLEYIDAIHISRHHYDDDINKALFGGANVPSGDKLKEIVSTVPFKDVFVLNCLLLKDYINSPEEAHRFLDFSIRTGVPKVGFMTCSPVNDFAERQTIPYESVINDDDPSLLFTRRFFDYEYCHCRDGVYVSPDGEVIEFYGRSTRTGGYKYSRGLVYDADDHLRDGFGGKVII
ncbi:MAG: radical SAM protein, partial [Clostridia bacterium]|nr:radical SAM protein [Clostridia bacterium]